MSKKILKRSLALGALIAFVITGNAWAADRVNNNSINSVPINDEFEELPHVSYGGAIYNTGTLVVQASEFNKNSASNGGAIYNTGKLTIEKGSIFDGNVATGASTGGGAICNSYGEVTLIDCTFKNNSVSNAKRPGGAIYNVGGKLNMTNVTFESNSITYSGSSRGGSAVYNSDGTGIWEKCTFSDNKVSPAVFVTGSRSNVTIKNGTFTDNERGGLQVNNGDVIFQGESNNLTGNKKKAAIYVSDKGYVKFDSGSKTNMDKNTAGDIQIKGNAIVDVEDRAEVTSKSGIIKDGANGWLNINGGTLAVGANSSIANLGGTGGTIKFLEKIVFTVDNNEVTGKLDFVVEDGTVTDAVNGDVEKLIGNEFAGNDSGATFRLGRGSVAGEVEGTLVKDETTGMYVVESSDEKPHEGNAAISHNANIAMMAWRAETNDMNKRLGELRNANGDLGVWVRMVGGEDEFKSVEYEYTQYQLGYDEKLSIDPSWTVGVALSYTDGESKFTDGSGENTHKGLSVYGSKLNDDGSFIDLIAKYSRLEHDLTSNGDKGDYSTNGYSVSAEYGKRFQQGKGLWIEPQVELTYGKVKSAEYKLGDKTVSQDAMESLVGRVGFSLGKDIKQGNVYARASYLYDFEGETNMAFANGGARREFKYDLGGGWWEVGVGANINLSKATYIYADVEKTFGGEVDTNWQWNLGVRYSF